MISTRDQHPIFPGSAYFSTCILVLLGWRIIPAGIYHPKNWYLYCIGWIFYICAFGMLFRGFRGSWHKHSRHQAKTDLSEKYGTAKFAILRDLRKQDMLKPDMEGLFLGSLNRRPLFYNGKSHLLTVAPNRTGKSSSAAIPALLHNVNKSMFVTDPKGELAVATAEHRAQYGDIYVINPFNLHKGILPNHGYNPLRMLLDDVADSKRTHLLKHDIDEISLQLIPEPGDSSGGGGDKNKFFRDGARDIITSLQLYLAVEGEPALCNLPYIWSLLQSPERMKAILKKMALSEAFGGALQDMTSGLVDSMAQGSSEVFQSFLSNARTALSVFSPIGALHDSISDSEFRFEQLKERPTTVYLVVPGEYVETTSAWLGLIAKQAIRGVIRARSSSRVLFLLDEFNNIKVSHITSDLTLLPGLGVQCWMMAHGPAAIRKAYGDNDLHTIFSQAEVKQVFGLHDPHFAREMSQDLGEMTVKTESESVDDFDQKVTQSYGEMSRPLTAPDQLRQFDKDEQLIFFSNAPAIKATRVPFWDVIPWRNWAKKNPIEKNPLPRINRKNKLVFRYN